MGMQSSGRRDADPGGRAIMRLRGLAHSPGTTVAIGIPSVGNPIRDLPITIPCWCWIVTESVTDVDRVGCVVAREITGDDVRINGKVLVVGVVDVITWLARHLRALLTNIRLLGHVREVRPRNV